MISHKPKILIVDDDIRILELLKQFFEKNEFECYVAADAESALKIMSINEVNLLILDVMMPNVTGFELANKIKSKDKKPPIIMLTALTDADHRVKGLEAGADDYITKPFDPRELILRAKNLLELYKTNSAKTEDQIFTWGNLEYNLSLKKLYSNGEIVLLSSTEQKLLDEFVLNKGIILTREMLSKKMGGLSDRSIDVQIVRLRQKIEEDPAKPKYLITVRHEGYALYI